MLLIKIELTLLILSITLFLISWLAADAASQDHEKKIKHFASNVAILSFVGTAGILVILAITAIWTFL